MVTRKAGEIMISYIHNLYTSENLRGEALVTPLKNYNVYLRRNKLAIVTAVVAYPIFGALALLGMVIKALDLSLRVHLANRHFDEKRNPPNPDVPKNPPPSERQSDPAAPPQPEAPPQQTDRAPSSSAASRSRLTTTIVLEAERANIELLEQFNRLKTFTGPEADRLIQGIKTFRSQYDCYRDPVWGNALTKTFTSFDRMAAAVDTILKAHLTWQTYYQHRADRNDIIQQPADGNCFFHTVITGLRVAGLVEDTMTSDELRTRVGDWIDGNRQDENLQILLLAAVQDYRDHQRELLGFESLGIQAARALKNMNEDEIRGAQARIQNERAALERFSDDNYVQHIRQNGFHAGQVECYVISKLFNVNIIIWRHLRAHDGQPAQIVKDPTDLQPLGRPKAGSIIHAVLSQEGNHFDYRLPQ